MSSTSSLNSCDVSAFLSPFPHHRQTYITSSRTKLLFLEILSVTFGGLAVTVAIFGLLFAYCPPFVRLVQRVRGNGSDNPGLVEEAIPMYPPQPVPPQALVDILGQVKLLVKLNVLMTNSLQASEGALLDAVQELRVVARALTSSPTQG